jgi:hypothetical protein
MKKEPPKVNWNWIAFIDEVPEEDRLIIMGNHRWVETLLYSRNHPRVVEGKISYKDITHWCYIELPPAVDLEKFAWKT